MHNKTVLVLVRDLHTLQYILTLHLLLDMNKTGLMKTHDPPRCLVLLLGSGGLNQTAQPLFV